MKTFVFILLGVLLVALILYGPYLTIWALNTLFPSLEIPYNWSTWAAVIVLASIISPPSFSKNE